MFVLKNYANNYIRYYNYKDNEKAFQKTFLMASFVGLFTFVTGGYMTMIVFSLYDNIYPLFGVIAGSILYLLYEFLYTGKPFYYAKVIGMHGENRGNTLINTALIMIFVGPFELLLYILYYLF
jgi:hypothetical protein